MWDQTGFSLIEILIVITVMGILFTVALPVNPAKDFEIKQQLESLAADLRWARNKAVLDNQIYISKNEVELEIGEIYQAVIKEAFHYDLIGEIEDESTK